MKYDILLITPDTDEYQSFTQEQVAMLQQYGVEYVDHRMPGTVPSGGYELTHVLADCTLEEAEAIIDSNSLDWQIIGFQREDGVCYRPVSLSLCQPFWPTGSVMYPIDPLTSGDQLHVYEGHAPWVAV